MPLLRGGTVHDHSRVTWRCGAREDAVALNFSPADQLVDIPFPANGTWTDVLPPDRPDGVPVEVQGHFLRGWTLRSNWGCIFFQ